MLNTLQSRSKNQPQRCHHQQYNSSAWQCCLPLLLVLQNQQQQHRQKLRSCAHQWRHQPLCAPTRLESPFALTALVVQLAALQLARQAGVAAPSPTPSAARTTSTAVHPTTQCVICCTMCAAEAWKQLKPRLKAHQTLCHGRAGWRCRKGRKQQLACYTRFHLKQQVCKLLSGSNRYWVCVTQGFKRLEQQRLASALVPLLVPLHNLRGQATTARESNVSHNWVFAAFSPLLISFRSAIPLGILWWLPRACRRTAKLAPASSARPSHQGWHPRLPEPLMLRCCHHHCLTCLWGVCGCRVVGWWTKVFVCCAWACIEWCTHLRRQQCHTWQEHG